LTGSDHKNKFLLTNREREVFELLVQDKTTRDIAQQLFISEKTVRNHISNATGFEIHKGSYGMLKGMPPRSRKAFWGIVCGDTGFSQENKNGRTLKILDLARHSSDDLETSDQEIVARRLEHVRERRYDGQDAAEKNRELEKAICDHRGGGV